MVLSTIRGTFAFLATFAIASTSVMTPPGLAMNSTKIAFVLSVKSGLEAVGIVGIGKARRPAEVLEGVIELVDRAAIKLVGGDDLVARLHQGVEGDELGRVAAKRRRAPPCRPRARRPVPRAPRRSDCRCANRYCRRPASRKARPRGRHCRRRKRSSDRSGSRGHRSPDRAGPQHEPPRWKSPVRVSCEPLVGERRNAVSSNEGAAVNQRQWR